MDELLEDCCLHQQSVLDPVVFVEYSRLKNSCNKVFEIPALFCMQLWENSAQNEENLKNAYIILNFPTHSQDK